jgi:hypothetical protein
MICKAFEVRDEGTHIPVLAVKLLPHDERERLVLERAGFGSTAQVQGRSILLVSIAGEPYNATVNPHRFGRTLQAAHEYIEVYFASLMSGSLIDVRYALGETDAPCESELGK